MPENPSDQADQPGQAQPPHSLDPSREAALRLYRLALAGLPAHLREKAPSEEGADPKALAQWAELAAAMARDQRAPPKPVDGVRGGAVPQPSDAETWLRLLADGAAARDFKKSHPEEWRRLVARFGGRPGHVIRKMIAR